MSKAGEWKVAVAATVLASAFAAASAQVGAATLYRWTDANGTPVISDRPPPQGTAHTTLDTRGYGPKPSSTPTPTATPPSSEEQQNDGMLLSEGEKPQRRDQPAQASAEECAQIGDDIFKLETFARVRAVNPESGEVLYMTEEDRATRLSEAQQFQRERC
ncbi:MAG: DUF4124 domain-containing protein [Luminiphilus sp.]|nr:DUF4124 domain-containing protein [Luminiphilus sp.]